jgi:hypothetical protein
VLCEGWWVSNLVDREDVDLDLRTHRGMLNGTRLQIQVQVVIELDIVYLLLLISNRVLLTTAHLLLHFFYLGSLIRKLLCNHWLAELSSFWVMS